MLRHVGIVCHDLDKMIEFYELLGFYVVEKAIYDSSLLENLYRLSININLDVEIVKLKKAFSMIELIKYKNSTFYSQERYPYETGLTHIAITVRNLDEIYKILQGKGIKFNSLPIMTNDNVKVCFCKDFENNLIELVEDL